MTYLPGFNPADYVTSAARVTEGKGWSLGAVVRDHKGYEWTYVQASAAIPQNQLVRVLASGTAAPWTSAGISGTAGGVKCNAISASASIAADAYGWVMTKGQAGIKVKASGTGTIVPTGRLYAAASGSPGLVTPTASTTDFALVGLRVIATATTSGANSSTLPVVFWSGIEMTSADE